MTTRILRPLALALATVLLVGTPAGAEPVEVPVQGVLTDRDGAPIDEALEVAFALYDAEDAEVPLWSASRPVPFDGGFFTARLGADEPLDSTLFRDHPRLWLGVTVEDDEEMPRVPLHTAPRAGFAHHAGDAATLAGEPAERFQRADDPVAWDRLQGVPPELLDGDDDSTYGVVPGGGLVMEGALMGLDPACAEGELMMRSADGWVCQAVQVEQARLDEATLEGNTLRMVEDDAVIEVDLTPLGDDADADPVNELIEAVGLAGFTLQVADQGGVFSVDLSDLDDDDGDPLNEVLLSAALDGAVLRLVDAAGESAIDLAALIDDADADPSNERITQAELAGTLLRLTEGGQPVTVDLAPLVTDPADFQRRVAGACEPGSAIRSIGADGEVICQPNAAVAYRAGVGLALDGTTFSIDPTRTQARITGGCAAGSSIRIIDAEGRVICEADETYRAGDGLVLEGTTFSVDRAAIQSRVRESCPAGWAIRAINADGSVVCEEDTNTVYAGGQGVIIFGNLITLDSARVQLRVTGSCPAGQSIRSISALGLVTCETDDVYDAGNGLFRDGDRLALRVTGRYGTRGASSGSSGSLARAEHWLGIRFRVDGGGSSGRLEVSLDGATWGTVCDDYFTDDSARIACRAMGYSTGTMIPANQTRDGGGQVLLEDFQCSSDARNLLECRVRALGNTSCGHNEDVGVSCVN